MVSVAPDKQTLTLVPEEQVYVFNCPHCLGSVVVHCQEVNCQIFRHAVLKDSGAQVSPHASKVELEALVEQDRIHGCGLPFRIVKEQGSTTWTHAESCDYI